MRKSVVFVIALALLLLCGIAVLIFLFYQSNAEPCTTLPCVVSTNQILRYIDKTANPCDDFYQFACGSFLLESERNRSIPYSVKDEIAFTIKSRILDMLHQPIDSDDGHSMTLAKTFFQSCINETTIDAVGLRRIRSVLREAGSWPVLDGILWKESQFDWRKSLEALRRVGADHEIFLRVEYVRAQDDLTKFIISVEALKHKKYPDRKLQLDFMVDVATFFGANKNTAMVDMEAVMNFHAKLVEATEITRSIDDSYNPRTLRSFEIAYSGGKWLEHLRNIMAPKQLTQDDVLNVVNPSLFTRVLNIIYNTPKRTVANYILWETIHKYINILPKNFRMKQNRYVKVVLGERPEPQSQNCYQLLYECMEEPLEVAYYKKYLPDKVRYKIRQILEAIKKEYATLLDDIDWLDEEGKKAAKEKLFGGAEYITAAEFLIRENLDGDYQGIKVNDTDPLDILLTLGRKRMDQRMSNPRIQELADRSGYNIQKNRLVIPIDETQGVFFESDRPQYMNYGALGSALAYHLSHILLEGRNYDMYGNLRQWSTSDSLLKYGERLNCLTDQYREHYDLGEYGNSTATKVADLGDVLSKAIAYRAYVSWNEANKREMDLPGLSYTSKQLFWISSAIYECSKLPTGSVEDFKRSGPRIRVNGPLQNLEEFAEDFDCPLGSRMNSQERCSL